MIYKVKARINEHTIGEFYRKLADGTVAKQGPDGEEIVASMKRAVLTVPGVAEWYEKCFCPTPLHHERQTHYDLYFTDVTTTESEGYGEIKGESLWDYMASRAGKKPSSQPPKVRDLPAKKDAKGGYTLSGCTGPKPVAGSLEARHRVGAFFDDVMLYSASQFSEQQQQQALIEEDRRLIAQHQSTPAELQALDAARLRLLRTIAHELRNMLNTAVLTTENLIAEEDPTLRTELQEMLRRNYGQMTTLLNQLLEMAPLLARREALRLAPLDVRTFAAQQCKLFERMASSKHLKFRCAVPEVPSEIINDELKLQRIVTNLVQNAIKFTPSGGSVELRVELVDAERWRLSVLDTGPGIPEEHRAKIFDEFHRVPGTEQQEGTGLGLSIVRQLVGLMHGEISLESEVEVGSTFCITLPRDPGKVA